MASPGELALERNWKALLGVDTVDDVDNFFDLGGDSLAAVELVESVQDESGFVLDLERLFVDGSFGDARASLVPPS